MTLQKQIIDKIQYYNDEAVLCDARNQTAKADRYRSRAEGIEEAYKIFISQEAK